MLFQTLTKASRNEVLEPLNRKKVKLVEAVDDLSWSGGVLLPGRQSRPPEAVPQLLRENHFRFIITI